MVGSLQRSLREHWIDLTLVDWAQVALRRSVKHLSEHYSYVVSDYKLHLPQYIHSVYLWPGQPEGPYPIGIALLGYEKLDRIPQVTCILQKNHQQEL